jgi:hypothetical protein
MVETRDGSKNTRPDSLDGRRFMGARRFPDGRAVAAVILFAGMGHYPDRTRDAVVDGPQ